MTLARSVLICLTVLGGGLAHASDWSFLYQVRFGKSGAEVQGSLRWIGDPDRRPEFATLEPNDLGRIPLDDGAVGTFRYTVSPLDGADGALWTGRSLFAVAPGSVAQVELLADDDRTVSVGWTPVPNSPGVYRADGRRLGDALIVVGRQTEQRFELGPTTVVLAIDPTAAAAASVLRSAISDVLMDTATSLGASSPDRSLIAVRAAPQVLTTVVSGRALGQDVSLVLSRGAVDDGASRLWPSLSHQLLQLWTGRLAPDGGRDGLVEGATAYYVHTLAARSGRIASEDLTGWLRGVVERTLSDHPPTGSADAGVLRALCLDVEIRAASDNGRSLADVIASMPQDIDAAVSAVAGQPMQGLCQEPLPVSSTLAKAGLLLDRPLADVFELETLLWSLLELPSVATTSNGLKIGSGALPPFESDDVIIELSGAPATTLPELRDAAEGLEPGTLVPVTVIRQREERILEVVLGDAVLEAADPSATVWILPDPNASRLAREIRRSAFGLP